MKACRILLWCVAAAALVAAIAMFIVGLTAMGKPMDEKNLTLVAAGPGYAAQEAEEAAERGLLSATANASTQVSGYSPAFALDGEIESYWEGSGDYPQSFTLALEEDKPVVRMVLKLNPIEIWGKRTQSFAIETSEDGEVYQVALPDTVYTFDWAEGNTVEITFADGGLAAKFIRLVFSSNSGAGGGQLAEVELYGA